MISAGSDLEDHMVLAFKAARNVCDTRLERGVLPDRCTPSVMVTAVNPILGTPTVDAVKNALIKDGRTMTHDPFRVQFDC